MFLQLFNRLFFEVINLNYVITVAHDVFIHNMNKLLNVVGYDKKFSQPALEVY